MVNTRESISKFIALSANYDLIPIESKIEREANKLSDLIRGRIQSRSVEDVAKGLIPEIYNFRILLVKLMQEKGLDFTEYFSLLDSEIANKLQLAEFSALNKILAQVNLYHSEISLAYLNHHKISSLQQIKETPDDMNFEKLIYVIEQAAPFIPSNKFLKNWIEESLKLEVGLVLSDWVLTDQVPFQKEKINSELIPFFRRTITRFGAFSILLGIWRPENYHAEPITNDMETLAATFRIDNGIFRKMNLSDLSNLIEN